MVILNQKNLILVNDVTSSKNHDYTLGIYLTNGKVTTCIMVAGNSTERNSQKIKQKRRQPPESCIFNKSNVKLFRNAKTP